MRKFLPIIFCQFRGFLVCCFLLLSSGLHAQLAVYEAEPNDSPAEANPVSGAVRIMGSMSGNDQDGFKWVVTDVDAQKRWTLTLTGIPGALTLVEVFRLEYADNGVDVVGKQKLFGFGSRDGTQPAVLEDLVFEPGEYILGVAHSGGGQAAFRPPVDSVGFGEATGAAPAATEAPGGYRLAIQKGAGITLSGYALENSSLDSAHKLRLDSEFSAVLSAPESWFSFGLDAAAAGRRWEVHGQVPVGVAATARLVTAGGEVLDEQRVDLHGKVRFVDLGLAAGTYAISLGNKPAATVTSVAIRSTGIRVAGAEAEPNDQWSQANVADLDQALSGRSGVRGDRDDFRFALDEAQADQVLALRLEAAEGQSFEFCLLDSKGAYIQCRTREGGVELPDLVLQPGDWGVRISRGAEGAEYRVVLESSGPISADVEAEPNDTVAYAAGVPANHRVKGRFSGQDDDFYRFVVTEEPQLWRFQAIGDEIHELAYYDGAGQQSQRYRIPAGQRRVRLDNVFLLPGVHHVRITGRDGGAYTLMARPIGPPDPNGEFEPNDDASRMQLLRIGQARTGLLEDTADRDFYRFYLANRDRVRLTIDPPPDGEIFASVYWGGATFKQFNRPEPGQKIELEGVFPPGDYHLMLSAKTTSEAEYRLGLERLDRYGCPTDCEPNDNHDYANPFPASHIIEGVVNEWRDNDWFGLPVFEQPTVVTLIPAERLNAAVVERGYSPPDFVEWDHEAGHFRGTVPAGVQTYLRINGGASQAYRFDVVFEGGPEPQTVPGEPLLQLSVDLDATEVGAYLEYGQRLNGELVLANKGTKPLTVSLNATTSDHRWRVEIPDSAVTVPAGATKRIPATVHVPADAWAVVPVRISARALSAGGGQVEASVDVRAGADKPAVNAVHGWSLPATLRGGFNVAWNVLGGRWTGEKDTEIGSGFEFLNDGMAVEQQGLQLRGGIQVRTVNFDVELAGGKPVEVAGLALNLLAGAYSQTYLRNLDFAVSMDGQQFMTVLEGELEPIRAEQAFVMDQPVTARFARLQIKHAYDGAAGSPITLGEVKVIARPGTDISLGKGFNLADPELGGHVTWSRPPLAVQEWDEKLLSDETGRYSIRLKPGLAQEFVIGFHHSRAAQINRLEWLDTAVAGGQRKFRQVAVSVSLDSPLGPWAPIGDIDLADRQADSNASVLALETPVWARYVKFSATGGADTGHTESPSLIRIWERPVDDEYRSILGEWGFASQAAIYEHLHPLPVAEPFRAAGNDSKPNAAALAPQQTATGQVVLGKHEHWYRVDMPAGTNLLTLVVAGDPTVRTVVHIEDEAGSAIPVRKVESESTPRRHTLEAVVDPGGRYYLKIDEPPRNVAFLWDTSASVGAYLPVIYNSLMAYAEDVVPGRDAANFIPFGGRLLLRDWYGEPFVLQTVLNDYPRKESSSEAEGTLYTASRELAPRAGTKAIVMVTDAATNRFAPVWDELEQVRPRVFGLGVGSQGALGRNITREQDLMQDWSRVNGGHYAHLLNEGEMEIAFDRVATMLRRPAHYTLQVSASFREAPGPGTLEVTAAAGQVTAGGAVELILDASGSMLKRMDGKRRIVIAKEVLTEAVNERIPAGTPVALRVFGHREVNSCRTDLEIALAPLDPAAASKAIAGVNAMNLAKTPIADSLARVSSDLAQANGRKVVILVTDGEETCEGDPEKAIQALQAAGIDAMLNIVGFAIDDAALEGQFAGWAELGGGRYFSAQDQQGLSESIEEALRVPYTVYDQAGSLVAAGVVGGEPLEIDAGFYRVSVATSPATVFERVEIPGEESIVLEVGGG